MTQATLHTIPFRYVFVTISFAPEFLNTARQVAREFYRWCGVLVRTQAVEYPHAREDFYSARGQVDDRISGKESKAPRAGSGTLISSPNAREFSEARWPPEDHMARY